MRFLTPTERGYLTDPEGHSCFVYVEVTNADGTWINLSDVVVGSRTADFLTTFAFSDNQDANTHSITITLFRDIGAYSLSPFRSDSPLNVDDSSAFAPLADLHRQWRIWGCILPLGSFPSSPSDYREWWRGSTDRLDVQGDGEPAVITLQGRGSEADLIDARVIDVPKTYAADDLGPFIQTALDDQFGVGAIPLTLASSAPAFFVNQRDLGPADDMGFFDLISETAALPGALLRYKYDASDVLSFTLFAPNRTPSTPDWTTDGDEYEALDVGIGLDAVRNYVRVRYMDAAFGLQTVTSPATPVSASITRYGLRAMTIDLAASTTITDQTAAGNLADAVRSDLEFPIIEHTLTGRGLWFAELGDYVQLAANGVHYDQDQFGAVTSIQHTFENGELKSVLGMRATPSGRYRGWLDFGPTAPRALFVPAVTLLSAVFTETTFLLTRIAAVTWTATVNQYTRSVMAELSATDDFAVVLDTASVDVTNGVAAGVFSGVARDQIYYVRVTPYSGPLSGGVPTGVAGLPVIDSTFVQFEVPDKPSFDTLQSDVTTLTSDLATETAARIAGDASTLASAQSYTDAKVAGLSWKQAVRAATTAAGTLASSFENGDTIDGVTLATGDRILIKNQATASENGIYVVNASGAPTRATDADAGAELVNATCYVSEGTTNGDTQWTCTTNAPITVGSTSLAFAQLATGSVGTQSANTVYAGPTSGGVALPSFRALVAADIPSLDAAKITTGVLAMARLATGTPDGTKFVRDDGTLATPAASLTFRQDLTRTAANTVDSTVELGSWNSVNAFHLVTLRWNVSGAASSRVFLIPASFDKTSGAWQKVFPVFASSYGPDDVALEVKINTTDTFFRLRRTVLGAGAFTVSAVLECYGALSPTFTSSTTTSTSAITAIYGDRLRLEGIDQGGAIDGYVLAWNDTTKAWAPVSASVVTQNTQTASYTAVLADAGKVIEMNVASANNFTVPTNASVAFPIGTVLEVYQMGAGLTTILPAFGVTIRYTSTLTMRGQYATVSLRKRATDEWVASGEFG